MEMEYRRATDDDLESLWRANIADNSSDPRWSQWKVEYIGYNHDGRGVTFAVVCDGEPVGEGTLLFSPDCRAIGGQTGLADGMTVANINALRIRKTYEGQGHISALVRLMEQYARDRGIKRLTIGVDAKESRNLAIYLHWGYSRYITYEIEDDQPVLYYAKELNP